MKRAPLPQELIEQENQQRLAALEDEYAGLGRALDRRGRSIDEVKDAVKAFARSCRHSPLQMREPRITASGLTTLTRIPCGAPSTARHRARCSAAAFADA